MAARRRDWQGTVPAREAVQDASGRAEEMLKRFGLTSLGRARTGLASLLVLGIVLHLLQFPFIEVNSTDNTGALARTLTSDILAESLPYDNNAYSRYAYTVALAEIAPESTIYLASDAVDLNRRLYGFGEASRVVVVSETSAEILGSFDPTQDVVASGHGGRHGAPWLIAIQPGTGSYGEPGDPASFLNYVFSTAGRRQHEGGPARTFVAVVIPNPPGDTEQAWTYRHALIEISLLGLDEKDFKP